MKIAVWKTGHEIADTVADALLKEFGDGMGLGRLAKAKGLLFGDHIGGEDRVAMGYGILRGTAELFRKSKHWFNIDRGYWGARHFDGNYRISYRGTQFKWHEGIPRKPVDVNLEPWRFDGEYILICFPSQHVIDFFKLGSAWLNGIPITAEFLNYMPYRARMKDSVVPLEQDLAGAKAVITFNSTVGIEALKRGIPVLSDVNHSAIGSFYGCTDLSTLMENLQNNPDNRIELFEAMEAHQFKLNDTSGLWGLLSHYISGLDMTAEKPLPQMSSLIVSESAPKLSLASHFSSTGN